MITTKIKGIHLETFYQPAEPEYRIPATWVVMYCLKQSNNTAPIAAYFPTEEQAKEFECVL